MIKSRLLAAITVLTLSILTFTAQIQPAHAANCDGLQTTGNIPAGTYTLTDNCVTTGTLTVTAGTTVTINGNGFTIDANNAFNDVLHIEGGATLNLNNATIRNGNDDGISNFGTVTLINTTVSDNNYGIYNNGTATLTNSTVSDNDDGISNSGIASITITNGNVSGNTYGILNFGTVTLTNSIISANSIANCFNTLTDGGGNLIHTANGGACTGVTPLVDADPLLGAFNGSYYPLLAGSPAIDGAPNCAGLTDDQIGTARPQGVACDIGAIEMPQTVVTNPTTGQPTFELVPIVNPAVPSLNEWNATASETRAEAYGVQDNVYATIHMQNGAWQYNSGGVPQALIDYGVIMAIDVWEQGGDQVFDHYEKVCLLGEGRLIYFDATQSPRPMVEITPVTFEDGYTCGWIPNAGTLVLIEPE